MTERGTWLRENAGKSLSGWRGRCASLWRGLGFKHCIGQTCSRPFHDVAKSWVLFLVGSEVPMAEATCSCALVHSPARTAQQAEGAGGPAAAAPRDGTDAGGQGGEGAQGTSPPACY